MENNLNPALADAQRRLELLREEEARLAEQQRSEQQRTDEQRSRARDERQGPEQGVDAMLDERDQERANLQADNREADNLQDSYRREDANREEDRRKEDDRREDSRREEQRRAERSPAAEEVTNSEVTQQIDVSRVGRVEQSEENSLIAQVQRSEAEQKPGQGTDSSESASLSSRPSDRGGKNVLDPNDLANQERQQQTPRPGGERVGSAQISEVEAKAERAHSAQGVRNQMASRDSMKESLGQGNQGGQSGPGVGTSLAERTRARNNQATEMNVAAGKTEPPAATREFAENSQERLVAAEQKAQVKETAKKPELTQ